MGYVGYGEPGVQQHSAGQPSTGLNPQLNQLGQLYKNAVLNPSLAMGEGQLQQLGNQDVLQQMQASLQGGQEQQQAGFQLQGLGLDTSALGIQQGALGRQEALLPQQYGLQTQGFDLSQAQQQAAAAQQLQNLNSSQTARGAYTSQGANQGRANIQQNLQFGLQGLGLQRQGAQLDFKEQQAQQQDAQKQLDLQSQRLGISKDEIKSRLDNALQQLGISSKISSDQILADQAKVAQGMIGQYQQYYADIYSAAGITVPSQ